MSKLSNWVGEKIASIVGVNAVIPTDDIHIDNDPEAISSYQIVAITEDDILEVGPVFVERNGFQYPEWLVTSEGAKYLFQRTVPANWIENRVERIKSDLTVTFHGAIYR